MASYTPKGWKMSREGTARFMGLQPVIERIINTRVAKYTKGVPGYGPNDLKQEARLAAAYAVDTFKEERGNINGYIGSCVGNALAMVASEALAQCRTSHTQVQGPDGAWVKVPVSNAELLDIHVDEKATAEQTLINRERQADTDRRRAVRMPALIGGLDLSEDANTLLRLKSNPPPELWVLARNRNGGQYRLNAALLAEHLGWPMARFNRAIGELNAAMRELAELGDAAEVA